MIRFVIAAVLLFVIFVDSYRFVGIYGENFVSFDSTTGNFTNVAIIPSSAGAYSGRLNDDGTVYAAK